MELTLALTHSCNLACTYCYAGAKGDRRISSEIIDRALDLAFAHPSPAVRVMPFGGEPLLEPALLEHIAVEAQARAKQHGKTVQLGLTCNGTLLTDERVALLERCNYRLTVSLDGDRAAHDSARRFPDGGSSFDLVVAGLERARDRLGHVKTVSVVHPGNVDRLAESFSFLSSLGVRQMAFTLDYDAEWTDDALDRYEAALARLAEAAMERYRRGEDFSLQPLHGKIVSRLKGGLCASDRCAFGCGELAVAPSGNLYPCDRLIGEDGPAQADVRIGDVFSGIDGDRVTALRGVKDAPQADCVGCAILDRCMWWCGCVNRARTGRVGEVDDVLCRTEQAKVRAADHLAATLFAEQDPTFIGRYYLAATAGR